MHPTKSTAHQNQGSALLEPAESTCHGKRPGFARWAIASACRCLLITAIVLPIGVEPVTHAQSSFDNNCRYFAPTSHYVCDQFLEYFETRGGLDIFGYPLSERFNDPAHGERLVQYFQRARMEWHPGNPALYQVQLGLLIDELGYRFPPARPEDLPAPNDPAHHYFPETQHVVSYAFLDTFREKGGLDIFGYPRSEFLFEDGKVVQYFQRARMEWYRNEPGQPVRLANVGESYAEIFPVPNDPFRPVSDGNGNRPVTTPRTMFLPLVLENAAPRMVTPPAEPSQPPATSVPGAPPTPMPTVIQLRVSASVRYPITGQTGTQTAFIYVNDQDGRPIQGARAQVVVHYPWGDLDCTPQPTDGAGFTWCGFEIRSPTPGEEVFIDIKVTDGELMARTQTFFMPWW